MRRSLFKLFLILIGIVLVGLYRLGEMIWWLIAPIFTWLINHLLLIGGIVGLLLTALKIFSAWATVVSNRILRPAKPYIRFFVSSYLDKHEGVYLPKISLEDIKPLHDTLKDKLIDVDLKLLHQAVERELRSQARP